MKHLLRLYQNINRKRIGLTLVEILVVTTIFLIVATSLSVVFKAGLDSWRRTQSRLDMYQKARMALDLMTRDISAAYINSSDPTITFKGFDASGKSGLLSGASASDELFFIAALNPTLTNPNALIDLCKVGYWRNTDNILERIYVVQTQAPPTFTFSSSDENSSSKVASRVTQLNFRYWDSEASPAQFVDTWDSSAGSQKDRLPSMVEVTITIQDVIANTTHNFTTNIYIAGSQI